MHNDNMFFIISLLTKQAIVVQRLSNASDWTIHYNVSTNGFATTLYWSCHAVALDCVTHIINMAV